jgi:VWFA-related protein
MPAGPKEKTTQRHCRTCLIFDGALATEMARLKPVEVDRMSLNPRLAASILMILLCSGSAFARQSAPATPGTISLDVVVAPKSGAPVSGLEQQDFTVLDNKVPQAITSFRAVRGREAPVEVILVLDDVNTGLSNIAYERTQLDKFLNIDGGRLAYPTATAFLLDSGIKIQDQFTTDGSAISAAVKKYDVGLHTILRSGGIYSAAERFQISLDALLQLGRFEASRPGRKLVLWISPGWPFLSGPGIEQQLDRKQQEQIFNDAVALSGLLRQAQITLYSIDPLSTQFSERDFYWQNFVKGINKPSQASFGNLALQVIATQTGGMAFPASNDIAGNLEKCLADALAYYQISFAQPLDQKPGEYHHIEIRVAKSGLIARTRQGYYSQQ